MLLLRCFLSWRSYARYEQSDLSQLDGQGGTKSAISYLDVIESYDARSSSYLGENIQTQDQISSQVGSAIGLRKQAQRYAPVTVDDRGRNSSTPALSYINTDQESFNG